MAKARVDVEANGVKFKSGLAEMRRDFREFTGELTEGAAMAGEFIGVALGAEMFRSTIEGFDKVAKMSEKFGESAETIQRVSMAAKQSGMDMDSLGTMMTRLNKSIETQAAGGKDLSDVWKLMGINAEEFAKLGMEDRILALSAGFDQAEKKGEGVYALTQLIGRSGGDMIPLLSKGQDELKKIFTDTAVASQVEVDEMENINDQLDQMTNTIKVGLVKEFEAAKYVLQSFVIAGGEVSLFMDKLDNKIGLMSDAAYEKSKETFDKVVQLGVKTVLEFNNIDAGGNPLGSKTADALNAKRKAAREALMASLENPDTPESKRQQEEKEGLRKEEEEVKRHDRAIDESTEASARYRDEINSQNLNETKEGRAQERALNESHRKDELQDLETSYIVMGMLTDEYEAKKLEINSKYDAENSKLTKADRDSDIREQEAIRRDKLATLKTDGETAANAELDPAKKRAIQRKNIKAELDLELADLKAQLEAKRITIEQATAQEALLNARAKLENGKLDAQVRAEFHPLDFSVDSFRARGGAGGHFGLGTGGSMSAELTAFLKTATNSEESLKTLRLIHDRMGKGKGFK